MVPFVAEAELTVKILNGLGPDFYEVSAAIHNRSILIEYPELYEKLLDHEIFLKHQGRQLSSPITAIVANRTTNNQNIRRYNNNSSNSNSPAWRPNNRYNQQPQWRQQNNNP